MVEDQDIVTKETKELDLKEEKRVKKEKLDLKRKLELIEREKKLREAQEIKD